MMEKNGNITEQTPQSNEPQAKKPEALDNDFTKQAAQAAAKTCKNGTCGCRKPDAS